MTRRPASEIVVLAEEALTALENAAAKPARTIVQNNLRAISSIASAMDARTGTQDPSLLHRIRSWISG